MKRKIETKLNFWPVLDLIKSCDEVIGSVNKLLFPLYKKKALDEVRLGGKISLLEPPTDLEGLNEDDIKFMIGEMEDKKGIPGWFDLTENVIYKAAENQSYSYPISILFFLLFGSVIVFIFDFFNLNKIILSSDIQYLLQDLIIFYFFGTIGFIIHLLKLIKENNSRITCIDDFLIWFSIVTILNNATFCV